MSHNPFENQVYWNNLLTANKEKYYGYGHNPFENQVYWNRDMIPNYGRHILPTS